MPAYHPQRIEPKWQAYWERNKTFRAADLVPGKPKLYVLDMFPYPSGAGLHVGHPEGYTATDIVCRYKRMRGFNVLHPMGWDAFGLPAEQYADQDRHATRAITTQKNIDTFRRQIKTLGFSYDWDREVDTTDPDYFKWTQWIFLQLFDTWYDPDFDDRPQPRPQGQGPADRRVADPRRARADPDAYRDSQAAGLPRRGAGQLVPRAGHRAGQRGGHRRQERARRLSRSSGCRCGSGCCGSPPTPSGCSTTWSRLDWPESIKDMQRNWIGRSEGAEVDFAIGDDRATRRRPATRRDAGRDVIRVFTTRPDTLFGATYMVLAPEHPLVDRAHDAGAAAPPSPPTAQAAAQERPRPHRPGQDEDRRLHRRATRSTRSTASRSRSGSPTTC